MRTTSHAGRLRSKPRGPLSRSQGKGITGGAEKEAKRQGENDERKGGEGQSKGGHGRGHWGGKGKREWAVAHDQPPGLEAA
eukprot:3383219-Pyramimonas_sp.AAC.1